VPLSARLQAMAVRGLVSGRRIAGTVAIAVSCVLLGPATRGSAQIDVTDAELVAISTRTVTLGLVSSGRVEEVPLEAYVARVLAGEGEPNAPDATQQALAIAIRTYALFNAGKHTADGYDLCDATHCQVPRAAAHANARRAAMLTAGQILTYQGSPAEIFYSASCGGRSEAVADAWQKTARPYLRSVKDNVHDDDVPWTLSLPLADVQADLERRGFSGHLKTVEIASRSKSGRAAVLKVSGMRPDRVGGDQLRSIIGFTKLRSTAFSVKKKDGQLLFTGRGYGHGVGMCVIGAGRRARRGETTFDILKTYYPGLKIEVLR
jgi:stage II sporulation protein D